MVEQEQEFMSDEMFIDTTNNMHNIIPHLYLSGYRPTEKLEVLKQNEIKTILTVADAFEHLFPNDFTYKTINIIDNHTEDIS